VGYEIVKEIVFLKDVAEAILYHHERVDGKGYPSGIKGEEIPLFARILAVADTYDAMTTSRPYRPALTKKEAMKELRVNASTQFDKEISRAMIEILKEESPS
jgi:HD-GYP domain-containing protein (c-di-GMP phosphodiesterase class II)